MNTSRLFTWVDVDAYFRMVLEQGGWPDWLQFASCYGSVLDLGVLSNHADLVGWLKSHFGPRVLTEGEVISLALDGGSNRFITVVPEVVDAAAAPLKLLFDPAGKIARPRPLVAQVASTPQLPIFAFHSFKGGVGRTTAALAFALELTKQSAPSPRRILLIDADMEAPGITFLLESRLPSLPVSFADFIALANEEVGTNRSRQAAAIVAESVRDLIFEGLTVLPAYRSADLYESSGVRPEHLIRNASDPFVVSGLIRELAAAVGAEAVVIDLRAGISEISSGLILDPTVNRVFVTTLGGQSVRGTRSVLAKVARSDELIASAVPLDQARRDISIVFSQVREDQKSNLLVAEVETLLSAAAVAPSEDFVTPNVCVIDYVGDLALMGKSWDGCLEQVRKADIASPLKSISAGAFPVRPHGPQSVSSPDAARTQLADFASKTEYAESGDGDEFLVTPALDHLASDHVSDVPVVAVVGQKGAGKSYTYLQLLRHTRWSQFVKATTDKESTVEADIFPLLEPINLTGAALQLVREAREAGVAKFTGHRVPAATAVRDLVRSAMSSDFHESQWRDLWFQAMAVALGLPAGVADPVAAVTACVAQAGTPLVFVVDGLEDLFQNIHTDEQEQRALRALLLDVVAWLSQVPGRPIGLVVFVRRDMVLAAIRQNPGQFLHRFQPYELRWERIDALRLVTWVADQSMAIPLQLEGRDESDLAEDLIPLWGLKLGAHDSREAHTADWVLAALSDFKGQVQARDVIRFLRVAAEESKSDQYWTDRLLTPPGLKRAPVTCGREKISEIEQETPQLKSVFARLRDVPSELKRVPFSAGEIGLEAAQVELLERNGIVLREPDGYYMPEMFRQGLGFVVPKGARPRVLALAKRARSGS